MINKMKCMFSRLAAQFLKPTLALLAACIVSALAGSAKGDLLKTSYEQNFEDEVDLNLLFGTTFAAYGNQIFGTTEGVGTESTGLNDAGSVSVVQYTPYEASVQTSIAQLTCMKKRAKVFGRIFPIPETAFTGASEYTVEFDYFPGAITGAGQTGLAIQGEKGVLATLNMGAGQKNGETTFTIYRGDATGSDLGTGKTAQRGVGPTGSSETWYDNGVAYWHHFTLVGNASGVKLSVRRVTGTDVLSEVTIADSYDTVKGLYFFMKTADNQDYEARAGLDNVKVLVPAPEGTPEPPTIASAINGASRTITLTAAEGAAIYYKDPTTGESVEYTEPFTISTSAKIIAWAVANNLSSDNAELYVYAGMTLNAPSLVRRGLYRMLVKAGNNPEDGSTPGYTYYYKYPQEEEASVAASTSASAQGPANSALIRVQHSNYFDANGTTFYAYATANGYNNSENATYTSYSFEGYNILYSMDWVEESVSARGAVWPDNTMYDFGGTSFRAIGYTGKSYANDYVMFSNSSDSGATPRWDLYRNGSVRYGLHFNGGSNVSGYVLFKQLKPGTLIYLNADVHHDPVNLTLLSSYDKTDEYVYEVTGEGDAVDATIRMTNYEKIYGMRILEPIAVASVNGVNYATLAAAIEASNGADITLLANTDETLTLNLAAWQKFIVGDYTHANVTIADGANGHELVYDSTTKTYTMVDNTVSTWTATSGGSWSDGSNWSTGVVPSRYTEVTISNAGEDYINVYLTAGAECKSMNVSGKVYFSQENAATDVHNAIAMYGDVTGTGTIKLVHTGFGNSSGAAITIAPDLLVADPGADSDSWISGGNITMSGSVTVERKFVIWDTNNAFSGSLTFSDNAHLGCWGEGVKGLVFNNVSITSGAGANIWLGNDNAKSSISGTGCTLSGSLRINTDNGTTISAPVTLNNNASLVVTDGGTISSVAAANATYLVADSTSGGLKTYTANAAPLVVNNVGYSTLANAWNAAGNDNNAAWIYVYASLPQEDTVTMTASWQKLRVVPGEYSIDGHVLLASTLENVALKKDVGTEMTEYTAYPTVQVTVTPGAGVASGEIANASSYLEKNGSVYTIYSGSEVTITWTAAEGYEFAGGETTATTVISPTENVTPECPTATLIPTGDVSISAPEVGAYGNDFATVTVTAGVTSTYPAATTITYTLKANGTAIATTTAAGDATSVTFNNADVSSLTRYGNISYTVEASGDNVTAATSGATTAMFADTIDWVNENYETTGDAATAGGAWQTAVTYDSETHKAAVVDNRFSATNCTTGDVVTVTIDDVVYTGLSDLTSADTDAQGAVAVGGTEAAPKFMLLTKKNDTVGWYEAAGVAPVLETGVYDIVMTFNYNSNTYTVTVNGTLLTVDGIASDLPLAKAQTSVKDIDFLGAGSLAAINGVQYEGKMAIDQNGRKYATVAEALEANANVKGAVIKLLHGSATTSAEGWNFDSETKTFVKKVIGLIFLAF